MLRCAVHGRDLLGAGAPCGAFPFLLKNDHFTKTGSGQTRGQKLTKKEARFLASGVRCVREPLRVQVDEGQKGGAHRANPYRNTRSCHTLAYTLYTAFH